MRKPDSVDVRTRVTAIQDAGAASLSFHGREEAIIVEGGALLGIDSLVLVDKPSSAAWLAKRRPYPRGTSFAPSIICMGGCLVSWKA
jgi:hypothetical protein